MTDQGPEAGRLSNTTTVRVTVTDENDNDPTFDSALYTQSIPENVPAPVQVATVSATDLDAGDNSAMKFSISAGDVSPALFAIDEQGSVTTVGKLDFEARFPPSYILTVTAEDPPLALAC